MPFRLTNAPATFQRLINHLLQPYNWIFSLVYLDDIIVYSENIEKHLDHLCKIICELRKFSLLIDFRNSEFCCTEIEYLGCIISADGTKIYETKIKAIKDYPVPRNVKEVQRLS